MLFEETRLYLCRSGGWSRRGFDADGISRRFAAKGTGTGPCDYPEGQGIRTLRGQSCLLPRNRTFGGSEGGKPLPSYSQVFGREMVSLAKKHDNLVAITAAMPDGTSLSEFRKLYLTGFLMWE